MGQDAGATRTRGLWGCRAGGGREPCELMYCRPGQGGGGSVG